MSNKPRGLSQKRKRQRTRKADSQAPKSEGPPRRAGQERQDAGRRQR